MSRYPLIGDELFASFVAKNFIKTTIRLQSRHKHIHPNRIPANLGQENNGTKGTNLAGCSIIAFDRTKKNGTFKVLS